MLLLGLAYKANTADLRESPALAVAKALTRLGVRLRYVDRHVDPEEVKAELPTAERADLSDEELASANAVIVLTDHRDVDYELVSAKASYVFDTRHRCVGPNVEFL